MFLFQMAGPESRFRQKEEMDKLSKSPSGQQVQKPAYAVTFTSQDKGFFTGKEVTATVSDKDNKPASGISFYINGKKYTSSTDGSVKIGMSPGNKLDKAGTYKVDAPADASYQLKDATLTVEEESAKKTPSKKGKGDQESDAKNKQATDDASAKNNKQIKEKVATKTELEPLNSIDWLPEFAALMKNGSGSIYSVEDLGGGRTWNLTRQNAVAKDVLVRMQGAGLMSKEDADAVYKGAWNNAEDGELSDTAKQQMAIFKLLFSYEGTRGAVKCGDLCDKLADMELGEIISMMQEGQDEKGAARTAAQKESGIVSLMGVTGGAKYWSNISLNISKEVPTESEDGGDEGDKDEVVKTGTKEAKSIFENYAELYKYATKDEKSQDVQTGKLLVDGVWENAKKSFNLDDKDKEAFITGICKNADGKLDLVNLEGKAYFLSMGFMGDALRYLHDNPQKNADLKKNDFVNLVNIYAPSITKPEEFDAQRQQKIGELHNKVKERVTELRQGKPLSLQECAFTNDEVFNSLYTGKDAQNNAVFLPTEQVNLTEAKFSGKVFATAQEALDAISMVSNPMGSYLYANSYVSRVRALETGDAPGYSAIADLIQKDPVGFINTLKTKLSDAGMKADGITPDEYAVMYLDASLKVLVKENNNEKASEYVGKTPAEFAELLVNGSRGDGVIHTGFLRSNVRIRSEAAGMVESGEVKKPVFPQQVAVQTEQKTDPAKQAVIDQIRVLLTTEPKWEDATKGSDIGDLTRALYYPLGTNFDAMKTAGDVKKAPVRTTEDYNALSAFIISKGSAVKNANSIDSPMVVGWIKEYGDAKPKSTDKGSSSTVQTGTKLTDEQVDNRIADIIVDYTQKNDVELPKAMLSHTGNDYDLLRKRLHEKGVAETNVNDITKDKVMGWIKEYDAQKTAPPSKTSVTLPDGQQVVIHKQQDDAQATGLAQVPKTDIPSFDKYSDNEDVKKAYASIPKNDQQAVMDYIKANPSIFALIPAAENLEVQQAVQNIGTAHDLVLEERNGSAQ